MPLQQWDVVKVRINSTDKDEHPAVIISPREVLADPNIRRINVLYGTTKRPASEATVTEVILNGAEGLERPTLFQCAHIYQVAPASISSHYGSVGVERRRQIGRKIIAAYRFGA